MNNSIINNRITKFLPINRIAEQNVTHEHIEMEETLRDMAFVLQMTRRVRMEMERELCVETPVS